MDYDVVWENTLDNGAYQCKVVRAEGDGYSGELVVSQDDEVIHREVVGLSYAARFGPDVADVAEWSERVVEVVDDPAKRSIS